jgi:uroporphyrinogen III methyltransferase / synthase
VLTRAPEQSHALREALESRGAEVILLPTVSFAPPEDWQELDEALRKLDGFDAILFVSKNAVRYLFERCRDLGIKLEAIGAPGRLIATVGPATGEAVGAEGVRVTYVAEESTGEGLARELRGFLHGRKVLLPRSDRSDDRLPKALRDAGAHVTEVITYRTITPEKMDHDILVRLQDGEVDAIVFASPSAFHNLSGLLGAAEMAHISQCVQFVAIGPTTARAIRDSGSRVEIEADEASAVGLARAVANFFERQASSARQR